MVIYDLVCGYGHTFEGWFASADAYQEQQKGLLVCCPVCQVSDVSKRPSAPHLKKDAAARRPEHLEASSIEHGAPAKLTRDGDTAPKQNKLAQSNSAQPPSRKIKSTQRAEEQKRLYLEYQSALKTVHDYIEKNFDDVGPKFTEKAIAMHKGELDSKNIRGTVSAKQTHELRERGVITVALPPKPIDKSKLN